MRYQVVVGSQSCHCCFEATGVDTSRPNTVCECFSMEDAQLICDALNAKDALALPYLEEEVEVCWDKKESLLSYLTPLTALKLPKLD